MIKPIGTLQHINSDGYLVNELDIQETQPEWMKATMYTAKELVKYFGENIHSIYIRGSVARGVAIDGISDLDLVLLIKQPLSDPELYELNVGMGWHDDFEKQVVAQFPFVESIECVQLPLEKFYTYNSGYRALLTLQGLCVYGEDVIPGLPPLKPGPDCFIHLSNITNELMRMKKRLQNDDTAKLTNTCWWLTKRLVRMGFELCMEREQAFTRDLYPCYATFAKYYPEQEASMKQALEWAIDPIGNREKLIKLVDGLCEWLESEAKKRYPQILSAQNH